MLLSFFFTALSASTVLAQTTINNNCLSGFEPRVSGNRCSCEVSSSSPGICRSESGQGVGCNPGYAAQVFGVGPEDCRCVESDIKGSCSITQLTWQNFDSKEACINAGCTDCTDVTSGSEPTWRGYSCTATPVGNGDSDSETGPGGSTSRTPQENALDFDVIQNISGVTMPQNLGEIISKFVPYVFGAAGIILFFYFIWGGFSWMMAKGDPKATAAARETITKAVVGFAIIFTAYWLTQILGKIFGVGQFNNIFQ